MADNRSEGIACWEQSFIPFSILHACTFFQANVKVKLAEPIVRSPMEGASAALKVEVANKFTNTWFGQRHRESTTYIIRKQYIFSKCMN